MILRIGERLTVGFPCSTGIPVITGTVQSITELDPVVIDMAGNTDRPILVRLLLDDGTTVTRRMLL